MDIQFRRAADQDGNTIADFIQAALKDMESVGGHKANHDEKFWQWYRKEITVFIRTDDRLYLFAQKKNSAIGFLEGKIIRLHEMFTNVNSFHISVVYVLPEARQRGVATALVQEALRWASEQGCGEADLNVLFNNEKARRLYKKIGFEVFKYNLRMKLNTNTKNLI